MSFIPARPAARHDFYARIHKGLRLAHGQLLTRLGACDGDDPQELADLLRDLTGMIHIGEHHLENEDRHVHTALEARAPGSTLRLARDHGHHRQGFADLERMIAQVETATPADRARALHALYLRYSQFVADDLAHMAEEELVILPVLQGLFTDEELAGIERTIVDSLSPEDKMATGRYMIPAATRAERIAFLGEIRAHAPAPAFQAIMAVAARPNLTADDYAHLCQGLGLAEAAATGA